MEDQTAYIETELKPGVCFPMGKDGTFWRVLEINSEENTIIVIASREICQRSYHINYEEVSWEDCSLRKWLNGDYFEETFSEQEKAAIQECELTNSNTPQYGTPSGNSTIDKIWLLSIEEAEKYFTSDGDRVTGKWWWLRSSGSGRRYAAEINREGAISYGGPGVNHDTDSVRPVIKINLKSEFFRSFIKNQEDNASKIVLRIPKLSIQNSTLMEVNPGAKDLGFCSVDAPEGITELGNVEALLLNYKQSHFENFDAMDEFTLDLL